MSTQSDTSELEQLHTLMVPVLARATLGDFSDQPQVRPEYSDKMNDLVAGVGVLLETIREKIIELETVNTTLEEAHTRSLKALDEVLQKSLESQRQLKPDKLVTRATDTHKA